MNYKYLSIDQVKSGDVVEFIDNSDFPQNPVGTLHIVGEVLQPDNKQLFNLTPPIKDMPAPQKHRFKLIATKPGSEAVNGDSVICIVGCNAGTVYHNIKVKVDIYYKPECSCHPSNVLVLCREPELLHQYWKDLYDQGVELEWRAVGVNWFAGSKFQEVTDLFIQTHKNKWNGKPYEYRIKQQPKHELAMAKSSGLGWYVGSLTDTNYFLRSDLTVQLYACHSSKVNVGYWQTEAEANLARTQYLGEQMEPEIKVGSHWERKRNDLYGSGYAGEVITIDLVENNEIYWDDCSKGLLKSLFLRKFTSRPDLNDKTVCNAQPQPIIKENTMDKTLLKLLETLLTQQEEPKSAINSEYVAIMTDSNNNYVGYVYFDTLEEATAIMQLPENEGKKLHTFQYNTTLAQKPRKVIEVGRM